MNNILQYLPSNQIIYNFCKAYINYYNGENNNNIESNGELRLLKLILQKCQVVFDVGANVGQWTALAYSINPGLEIHCFEPLSYPFKKLSDRKITGNIILNSFGLHSDENIKELYYTHSKTTLSSLYHRVGIQEVMSGETIKSEKVKLKTLDSYCEENAINRIDLLKIDVEGNELNVLQGAKEMPGFN
jgi:FkbM family methyltransferase